MVDLINPWSQNHMIEQLHRRYSKVVTYGKRRGF